LGSCNEDLKDEFRKLQEKNYYVLEYLPPTNGINTRLANKLDKSEIEWTTTDFAFAKIEGSMANTPEWLVPSSTIPGDHDNSVLIGFATTPLQRQRPSGLDTAELARREALVKKAIPEGNIKFFSPGVVGPRNDYIITHNANSSEGTIGGPLLATKEQGIYTSCTFFAINAGARPEDKWNYATLTTNPNFLVEWATYALPAIPDTLSPERARQLAQYLTLVDKAVTPDINSLNVLLERVKQNNEQRKKAMYDMHKL